MLNLGIYEIMNNHNRYYGPTCKMRKFKLLISPIHLRPALPFILQMNILIISFLAVASLSTFPVRSYGSTDVKDAAKAVAVAEQAQPVNDNALKEIWQEDDREVLIRNERGANKKDGNNGAAGKKGKKDKKNKLNKHEKPHPDTKQTEATQSKSIVQSYIGHVKKLLTPGAWAK
jgi:hypothetical protein